MAPPILCSFRLPVCNAQYIYIYIICDPMRNHNNEFILIIYIARIKMVDFKCRELKIGLEFGHISFDKRKNLSEGSSERKEYAQVI